MQNDGTDEGVGDSQEVRMGSMRGLPRPSHEKGAVGQHQVEVGQRERVGVGSLTKLCLSVLI